MSVKLKGNPEGYQRMGDDVMKRHVRTFCDVPVCLYQRKDVLTQRRGKVNQKVFEGYL